MESTSKARRSVCIFSLSCIPDDPRVRRQGDMFHAAGWTVHCFGVGDPTSALPPWNVYPGNWSPPPNQEPDASNLPKTGTAGRSQFSRGLLSRGLGYLHSYAPRVLAKLNPFMQKRLNAVHNWRWVLFQLELPKAWAARKDPESAVEGYLEHAAIRQLADVARSVKADIYLANDWHTLPVALTLAQQHDGYVCYDTHEYAIEEYRQYLDWRITRIPIAKAVEKTGLEKALVASTVSQGIADDMVGVYGLNKPILQIRNVPNRAHTEFKPCGSGKIRVLYHGLIVKDRGLEHCVRSVRYWRDEFIFLLRGPISDDFKKELEKIARESGVEDRVKFLPSAPMMDLVRLAREDGDIGLFTPLKLSRHYIYVLPNKLFEYIQAGLAICVADLPDMSRVVREHDLGHVIPVVKPKAIAEAINRFTRADIDRYKRNSIAASHELCWEVESQKMLSAYEAALAALGR